MSARAPLTPVQGLARTAKLPPPPPRRTAAPAEEPAPAQSPKPPVASARPENRPTPARSESAQMMRSITLSLPSMVVRQIKERARADGIPQAEVVMDALLTTRDELGQLLEQHHQPAISDGLFVRRVGARRGESEPLSTLSLRMLSSNVEAIDGLATAHGAPSRSALCLAALRAYLTT